MEVIPVIDVRGGVVVRAVAGDRAKYRPLETPLATSADPLDVARGLCTVFPFRRMYLADLDAIAGFAPCLSLLKALRGDDTSRELWVDSGARTSNEVAELLAIEGVVAVIGSETGLDPCEISALGSAYGDRVILSLDFKKTGFIGPSSVLDTPSCWPRRVIAMTLGRVGMAAGPDLERLRDVRARDVGTHVYAAGGIRNRADLESTREAGASGALVSTALHAQTITAADLDEISGR